MYVWGSDINLINAIKPNQFQLPLGILPLCYIHDLLIGNTMRLPLATKR